MNADSPNAGLRLLSEAISPHMKVFFSFSLIWLTFNLPKRHVKQKNMIVWQNRLGSADFLKTSCIKKLKIPKMKMIKI